MIRILAPLLDALVLLLFAAVGRASHGELASNPVLATAGVAAPFLAGWYAAALVGSVYRGITWTSLKRLLARTAGAWLVGGAIGLAIRSGLEGRIAPPTFVVIALSFNLVLLSLWRLAAYGIVRSHSSA